MADTTNKKFWQRIARLYAPLMESDPDFYREICARIRPHLKSDMEVLELACGPGPLSRPLSSNVREWLATDFSENMIAQAKKQGESERLHFSVADATALPYPDAHFDCVVIANALHIMPQPEQAMREISRVLKPGGLLCAPTFLWAEGKANKFRKRVMSLAGFKVYREWDSKSFSQFVRSYGFTVLEMDLVDGGLAPVGVLIAVKKR